nr:rRNA maturation RNase YbeY [Lewinella sp. W8]
MEEILFHEERGGQAPEQEHYLPLVRWITDVISRRQGKVGPINYIFCGDEYLHDMNVQYLDHDTLTDIITFPYASFPEISGDLFISTERVADNARQFSTKYSDELHRVIIHGILHLCGQGDKRPEEAEQMRTLEQWALDLRPAALLSDTGE